MWAGPVALFATAISTFILATVLMVLRLFARWMTKMPTWWDDWFAIAAWIASAGWTGIILTWILKLGLGRPVKELDMNVEEVTRHTLLLLWTAELVYAFSLGFSKLAILGFYWRLFKMSSIRIPIQVLAVCSLIWIIIRTFMGIFHCVPVQAFWEIAIKDKICNVDDSKFFFGTVLVHLVIDVVILVLPVLQVRNLRLRLGQKVAVIAVFMFGTVTCVASIGVLIESRRFNPFSQELPLAISGIIFWATMEVNFAIVSACLPLLRPIFRRVLPESSMGTKGSIHGLTKSSIKKGAMRLNTNTTTFEMEDLGSTKRLADVETASISSNEFDTSTGRPRGYTGPSTFSCVEADGENSNAKKVSRNFRGIHVHNEMRVSYERME